MIESIESHIPSKVTAEDAPATSGALVPISVPQGELVPRGIWLPQQARELFTERSCLLVADPYLLHGRANTLRGRRADWALFCSFCEKRSLPAMPASEGTVIAFLEEACCMPPLPGGRPRSENVRPASLARRARRARIREVTRFAGRARTDKRAAATLERYCSTIASAHRLAKQSDPTGSDAVRNALSALMSQLRSSKARAPLRREHLLELMEGLWPAQSIPSRAGSEGRREGGRSLRKGWRGASLPAAQLWDLRARALLATLYPTMARRSELLELHVEELPAMAPDGGAVPIHARKLHRQDHRYVDALALRSLQAWCEAAGLRSGPVFRTLDSRGRVGERAMSAPQLVAILRACWVHRAVQLKAGGQVSPLESVNVEDLGGHSGRIGAAHDLLAGGQDVLGIMQSGGWTDPRMPKKYTQELLATDSAMARLLRAPKGRVTHSRSRDGRRSEKGNRGKLRSPGRVRSTRKSR